MNIFALLKESWKRNWKTIIILFLFGIAGAYFFGWKGQNNFNIALYLSWFWGFGIMLLFARVLDQINFPGPRWIYLTIIIVSCLFMLGLAIFGAQTILNAILISLSAMVFLLALASLIDNHQKTQ